MRNFPTQVGPVGETVSSTTSWTSSNANDTMKEVQGTIENTGQTLVPVIDPADNTQLSEAVSRYSAAGTFYADSGAADAYVLSTLGSFKAPSEYLDGMIIRWVADNASTGGAATVNVAGIGVKSLTLEDGAVVPLDTINTFVENQGRYSASNDRVELVRAAGINASPDAQESATNANLGLDTSVAANALTIKITDFLGADPTSGSAVGLFFRSPTAASGVINKRTIVAALSLVVPSGAELGVIADEAFKLWFVALDDTGTVEIGVIKTDLGTDIRLIRNDVLEDATLIAATSDDAQVIYATSAHSADPISILGSATWSSGLSVPGTWDDDADIVEVFRPGISLPGEIIQTKHANFPNLITGTTIMPGANLDVIPINTQGDQYMNQQITLLNSANICIIDTKWFGSVTPIFSFLNLAVFQDAIVNSLASIAKNPHANTAANIIALRSIVKPNSTGLIDFKVRVGNQSTGTVTFNGVSGTRRLGGNAASYVEIQEVVT